MLSKIYRAARGAFSQSTASQENLSSQPGAQGEEPNVESIHDTNSDPTNMVTTRRQSGITPEEQLQQDNNDVQSQSPAAKDGLASSRKRRRPETTTSVAEQTENHTPSSTSKRQRKLPLRSRLEDDVESPASGRLTRSMRAAAVESSTDTPKRSTNKKTQASEHVDGEDEGADNGNSEDEDEDQDGSGSEQDVFVTPAQTFKKNASPQKRTPASAATPVPKHKRFGSEDPIEVIEEETKEELDEDEESESSDDDAPEVVTTQSATQKIKDAAREAAKARKQEEEAERRKRRDRDARLKEQAQTSNKRQKVGEQDKASGETPSKTEILDTDNLPEFLPLEYFKDPVDEVSDIARIEPLQKAKKTRFTEEIEAKPRDKTVGKTTFRVAQQNETVYLAPAAAKQAKGLKESLINARGMGGKPQGTVSKGFFIRR